MAIIPKRLQTEAAEVRDHATALLEGDENAGPEPIPFSQFVRDEFLPSVLEVEQPDEPAPAPHLERWADLIEQNPYTSIIAFRASLKSVLAKATFAWDLRQFERGIFEGFYFSASVTLAREHLTKLKLYLQPLAESWGWTDTTSGKALIRYERPGALFTVRPDGVDSRVRGMRANRLVLDDLIDPQKAVSMADVNRVLEAVRRRILPLLKSRQSQANAFGTPVIEGDVVDWLEENEQFVSEWLPIQDQHGNPTWPEKFDKDRIEQLRSLVGDNAFENEYMLRQKSEIDSFLDPDLIASAVYYPDSGESS
ncbi:MAG: hypothetical protein ABEL51_03720 [Salinibacter sp.]